MCHCYSYSYDTYNNVFKSYTLFRVFHYDMSPFYSLLHTAHCSMFRFSFSRVPHCNVFPFIRFYLPLNELCSLAIHSALLVMCSLVHSHVLLVMCSVVRSHMLLVMCSLVQSHLLHFALNYFVIRPLLLLVEVISFDTCSYALLSAIFFLAIHSHALLNFMCSLAIHSVALRTTERPLWFTPMFYSFLCVPLRFIPTLYSILCAPLLCILMRYILHSVRWDSFWCFPHSYVFRCHILSRAAYCTASAAIHFHALLNFVCSLAICSIFSRVIGYSVRCYSFSCLTFATGSHFYSLVSVAQYALLPLLHYLVEVHSSLLQWTIRHEIFGVQYFPGSVPIELCFIFYDNSYLVREIFERISIP
jgi:hypothetical protein